MAVKDSVPKPLRGPVGFASIAVAILGVAVGYILTMLGVMLYFDLELAQQINATQSLIVTGTGVLFFGVGYLGWKGFTYFAY